MISDLFKKYQSLIYQFLRFAGIGFLNTAIDFTIINILIVSTGVTAGFNLSLLKIVSFTVAVVHSYFWNKYWAFASSSEALLKFVFKLALGAGAGVLVVLLAVFGSKQEYSLLYFVLLLVGLAVAEVILWKTYGLSLAGGKKDGGQAQFNLFMVVSVIGALIAAAIVWAITDYVDSPFDMNARLWANLANMFAVGTALIWNFIGYKFFVFKK